jgi:hypothetical protein
MENTTGEIASYQAKFVSYLQTEKWAEASVKSTSADLDDFFAWVASARSFRGVRLSNGNKLATVFNLRALEQYFVQIRKTETISTSSKKIAALFGFCQFAVENKWLSSKLIEGFKLLANKQQTLLKFEAELLAQFKLSLQNSQNNPNTIRGYLADIAEYLQVNTAL